MTLKSTTIVAAVFTLAGCSSFSATINKIDDAGAGTPSATGGQSNASTTTQAGGTSTSGGATSGTHASGTTSNTLGTGVGGTTTSSSASAVGGTNGNATAAGGSQATGGTSSAIAPTTATTSAAGASSMSGTTATNTTTGGATATGGASTCTKDADCTNPDPVNCSYTCVNPGASGTCKPAALVGPTQCIDTACDDKPISGFWDANGKPHIAYAWTETDGTASIRMQQLKLDGTADGAAVVYALPAQQQEPTVLSANTQGAKVGLLWDTIVKVPSSQASADYEAVDFRDHGRYGCGLDAE